SKMGDSDINTLTMEQYLALTPGNQAPGVVKPKIKGNVNFEIKKLRRDGLTNYHQEQSTPGIFSKRHSFKGLGEVSKETEEGLPRVLPCQLPLKEMNPRSFTLSCIIDSLNLFAMADLGASVNIKSRSMFNHQKLTNLKETNMLVKMADMTKKAPVGIVENVMVKIDKVLFPSDFMIINMIGDPNETIILGRPFLSTIHARIDILDKEILLGVGEDRIVFDMNGNVHQPVAFIEKVGVINEVQEESFNPLEIGDDLFSYDSLLCLEVKRINHIFETNKNHEDTLIYDNMQEQYKGEKRKTTIAESKTTTSRLHYYKRLQVLRDGEFKFWPTCDPSLKVCNVGVRIHGLNKRGNIKQWECNHDDEIQNEKGKEMVFLDLLLIKYKNSKIDDKYGKSKKSWYDDGFKEEERWESGLDEKYYNPPQVCIDTFEVKRYSFKEGKSFVCVTKKLEDVLPLGWVNGLRFKGMIRKEIDTEVATAK
ncbi:reverse transcriptase domain-containing protein, partial [Tanacetum coccineum]